MWCMNDFVKSRFVAVTLPPCGPIWKVAWSGVAEKWPGAHKAIKNFTVNNDEMGAMVVAVDLEGKEVDAVVADWIANNEDRWKSWIE